MVRHTSLGYMKGSSYMKNYYFSYEYEWLDDKYFNKCEVPVRNETEVICITVSSVHF